MNNKVIELYGQYTRGNATLDWAKLAKKQHCPFLNGKCDKVRKSAPNISIGTCSLEHSRENKAVVICPHRLLERNQIFTDCLHLLTNNEPGNELHIVSQLSVPGGYVDYFLVSSKQGKVEDFVGIELQTLDTAEGPIWPERQRFLQQHGVRVKKADTESIKRCGINWKMSVKTALVQLHHKIETFESMNKHLVLVAQDYLVDYMRREFSFSHLANPARLGDSMHFHSYSLTASDTSLRLQLRERLSTDQAGIATCLGLHVSAQVELEQIIDKLQRSLSDTTLLTIQSAIPAPCAAR